MYIDKYWLQNIPHWAFLMFLFATQHETHRWPYLQSSSLCTIVTIVKFQWNLRFAILDFFGSLKRLFLFWRDFSFLKGLFLFKAGRASHSSSSDQFCPDFCLCFFSKLLLLKTFNRGDTKYHGGLCWGSYAKPLLCKRYPLTRRCSRRKSLFLNFAENAKVAATGFERETRGDLSSLSNSSLRTKRSRPPRPTSKLLRYWKFWLAFSSRKLSGSFKKIMITYFQREISRRDFCESAKEYLIKLLGLLQT